MASALEAGQAEAAGKDLLYCRANLDRLGISASGYAALEAKFSAITAVHDNYAEVVASFDRLRSALTFNNIAAAEQEAVFERRTAPALRRQMVPHVWDRVNLEQELLAAKLGVKEDSLAAKTERLLAEKGPETAEAFVDTMRVMGIPDVKVGRLDRLILEAATANRQREAAASAAAAAPQCTGLLSRGNRSIR